MIGSFAAQKIAPMDAARCGVYLHGMAADRCAKRLSQYGMLPSDLMTDLCQIFVERGL
jgi:NAD(P)H-hydrate epimerase